MFFRILCLISFFIFANKAFSEHSKANESLSYSSVNLEFQRKLNRDKYYFQNSFRLNRSNVKISKFSIYDDFFKWEEEKLEEESKVFLRVGLQKTVSSQRIINRTVTGALVGIIFGIPKDVPMEKTVLGCSIIGFVFGVLGI